MLTAKCWGHWGKAGGGAATVAVATGGGGGGKGASGSQAPQADNMPKKLPMEIRRTIERDNRTCPRRSCSTSLFAQKMDAVSPQRYET